MMIRNFLDLLQVLIKQNAKSNIKRQNSRLLIYDIYLKKYVNADELLIPSPTKESIKHLDNWEKSQSSPLFDLLLKKFVNPKLDLLCPTEQKFIPRGWDCSNVQGCRYASTLKGFWESGSGDNSRYPALPSSKDDVDRDQEEVGWAGQATGKPESNPRPERSSLLVAIKNPEKIGRKSQKLSKPIERVVKNANNMYKDGAPMPERRSDKNKQTLSTISQKPEKVSVPEKTPQTEKSNVKLSFYKGVGNDKKAEIRNRGELLKVKLPNNGKLLQLKKMCTQMFSIKKSKEREDGIKKNSLQEKTVIGTDSKVLFQDEQTFVENDTTEKDMVMNGKECQKDSQCLRTENNISISNNCSTEYKSAMRDKEHPNNKENVVSAKDMELTTKSFETTNRDHLSKMEINVRESTQDSDLNLRTNSDPQICKNKNMNMLKHNRNYLMKVTSNLTNVVTTVNCSIKNEKTGCEKKHDTRVINDEKKLTIEAKANTLVNNTHLKNKFKSQSQHLLNEHKKSSQEPSRPDKTIPFEELHNSLVLSSPKLESSLHDCDNNVIGQGECQNSVIHTQNNQKVVPENKLADIEAAHPIKSGQSGVISFIEVKKEGLPHTNPVGNESPSLNQNDKLKFQNNQAVVPKNKQADIETAHPIKSGQSGVISFIEVKKEGLPHTNPVGNESPSLNQDDKFKFQNNQAVVPKNKQADIEAAHPIKSGQSGVISFIEVKKEGLPHTNPVGNESPSLNQNDKLKFQNNQAVVPKNKQADIETAHPIKSGQSGVISFIEVKKEGLPHTNPVGNESPSLNQDDKFKFQNNQAVVPKNKQADIEAAHPIKSGQSGVISFIEVKKEGLPHTNPVGNESPSLNQNDKLKFQNNQAVVPKNKQADIETAHPIKKGQLGVISFIEAKKESSPCKNVGNKNPLVQQDKELKFQIANSDNASSFISESITHNSNQKQTQNQNLLLLPKTSDSDTTELTGIENPTKNNTYFTFQSKVRTKKDNEVKDSNAVKIHNMERKTIEKLRVISAEGKYLDNLTLDGELGQYNVTKYKGFKIVNSHSAVQEKKSLPIQTTSQKGLNSQLACTDNIISEKTVKLGTTESKSPQNNYQIKAVDSHVALQSKTPKNVKVKRNNNNKIIEQLRSFNGQKMAESKNIQPEPKTEDCSKVTKEVLKPKVVNKSLIEKSAANIVNPVDPKKVQMNTTKGNIESETTMLRPSENIKINNCIEENKQDDINKCGRRKHIKPTMFKYLTKKQRKNKNLKEQQEFKNINGKKEHQSVTFHLKNANLKTQRKVALRSKSVENVASINIHEKGNIVKSKSIVPLHLSQKSNFNKVVDGSSNGEQIQNLETKVTIEKGVRNTKTNLLPSNQSSLNGKQKISIPKQSPVSSQSKKNFVVDNLRTEKNLPTGAPKISTNVINSIPYSNINKSNKNVGMKQIKVFKSENFKISKSNQESKLSVTPKQENEVTDKTTKLSKIKLENGSTNSVALKCQNKQNFDMKNQNLPKTSGVQQKSKVNHAILKHKDLNNNNNNNRENNSLINTVHSEDQIKVVRRKEIISKNNKETLNRKQSLNSLKLISRGKPLNATENIIEKNTLNNTGFDGTKTKTAKIRQPTQENINFNQDNGFQDKRYLQKSVSNNTEDIKVSSKKDIDMNLTPTSKVLNKKYSTTDIKTVPNAQTITTGYKDLDRSKIIKKKLSNATANEYQNESLLRDQKENIGESALISKIKNNAMQRSIKLEDYIKRNVNNVIINSKAVSHAQQKNSIRNANLNLQDSTKFSNKKLSTEEGEKFIRGIHKSKNYLENKSSTLVAETKGPDKIKRNTTDLPLKTVKDKSIKSGKNCKTEKTEECELAALQRAEDQNIIEQPSTGIPANNLKLTSLYSRQNSNKPKSPVKQQANMMIKPNEPSTTKQIVIQKSNVEDHCSKITNVLKSDRQDLNTPKSGKVGSSTKIIPEKECNIKDQSTENPNQYKITMQKMYKGQNVKETVKVTNFEGPLKPLSGKSRPKTPNSITQSLEPHKKVDELLNYPHSLSNNSKKVSNKNNESLDLLLNTRQIELHTKLQTNSKFKITDIKNKTGSSKDLNVQETCNKAQQESVKKLPEEKIGRKGEGLTDQKNLIQGSSRKIYTKTTNKNNTTRNCGVTANQLRNVPISSKYGRKTLGSSQNNSQGSEETKNLIKTAKETIDFKDKMNSGVQNEKSETFKEDIRLKELLNHFCCQQNNGNDSGVMSCQSTYVRNNEHKDNNKKLLMDESKRPFKNNIKNFDTTNLSKQNNCTVSLDKEMLKLSLKNDEEAKFRKNHSLKSNHKQTVERIDNDGRTKSSSSSKKKESI